MKQIVENYNAADQYQKKARPTSTNSFVSFCFQSLPCQYLCSFCLKSIPWTTKEKLAQEEKDTFFPKFSNTICRSTKRWCVVVCTVNSRRALSSSLVANGVYPAGFAGFAGSLVVGADVKDAIGGWRRRSIVEQVVEVVGMVRWYLVVRVLVVFISWIISIVFILFLKIKCVLLPRNDLL